MKFQWLLSSLYLLYIVHMSRLLSIPSQSREEKKLCVCVCHVLCKARPMFCDTNMVREVSETGRGRERYTTVTLWHPTHKQKNREKKILYFYCRLRAWSIGGNVTPCLYSDMTASITMGYLRGLLNLGCS